MSVASPVVDLWDGENRRIYLKQGVDSFHWVEDIYPEYRYQRRTDENLRKFEPLLEALGNESKGAGRFTSRFVRLLTDGNGLTTKVIPFDESGEITALGEAITDVADTDPKLFDITPLTNAVVINYTPPDTEIIQVPISESDKQDIVDAVNANSQSTISEADQQAIADKVSENINPPTPPSTTPTIDEIREFFRTLHKYSNLKYILRINDNFLLTLKSELGFSSTDPVSDFLLLNYVINIEIDNGVSDGKFKLFGINATT